MISDERLGLIEALVCNSLNDEHTASKVPIDSLHPCWFNSYHFQAGIGAVNARVYAVKVKRMHVIPLLRELKNHWQANCNRLLDVARETYKENVGDIFQLNRQLSEEHDLPITLIYQDSGFAFTLKKRDVEGDLPKGFINVTTRNGKWLFSSLELVRCFHSFTP